MMRKNQHPFTAAGVLSYIQDNRGIRYQCNKLARVFKCASSSMRIHLQDLAHSGKILTSTDGKYRFYYLRTEEEEAAYRLNEKRNAPTKPLCGYDAMLAGRVELAMAVRR